MKLVWKRVALGSALALTLATAFPVTALPAAAQDQDHHDQGDHDRQTYANNSYYQTGNREGYEDYQKKVRRKEHHHKYRTDDDRRAHDQGYEQGWQGHQDHEDPH